ncbi:hypothetical protein V500_02411 [Pseudogymnoascus sp. VKM F-4518 (FW-2643)]|nr:hypothetical protein V500_02411 [Pseudogymnoascus sp. VKM F-4518 (FW-2643)]
MGLLDRMKGHKASTNGNDLDTSVRTSTNPMGQEGGLANVGFDHTTTDTDAIMNNPNLDDGKVPRVTFRTAIMAVVAAMGGFIFGYDTGQISGFLEMKVFLERFGEARSDGTFFFSHVRSGLIVGLLSIGTAIGALLAAPLADKIGRRGSIPWWCLIFAIGVTIQIAVGDGQWVGVAMGRFVAGLGVGSLSVLIPLYMSESTPKQVRGAVVCSYQLFITIGIFTASCINFGTETRSDTGSYRIPMAIGYIWALILCAGMFMMPESPRYDIKRGFNQRAFNTMQKFYGVPVNHRAIALETAEINANISASQGAHAWYEVFTGPRMGYRTTLAMVLQMFQQLTGANYFFYYGTTIFAGVGIENSYVTAMILGGVNVGATFFGLYFVEHFGRRKCLVAGALWMFVCFMIFASIGHFKFEPAVVNSSQAKTYGTVMIVFACLFICGFASTWGPMVWAVNSEMFPYRYRANAMALATASNWIWNFLLAFFTPFITGAIDFSYGYVFAGCNLAAAAIVYFFLIESATRTIEEVDTMYMIHVPPLKSSKWTSEMIERELAGSDNLHLARGGRKIEKRNREEEANAQQLEGVLGTEKATKAVGDGILPQHPLPATELPAHLQE